MPKRKNIEWGWKINTEGRGRRPPKKEEPPKEILPKPNTVNKSEKIKIGDWLLILREDGTLSVWNDNNKLAMVVKPRTGNSVDLIGFPL